MIKNAPRVYNDKEHIHDVTIEETVDSDVVLLQCLLC